jgi:hypothetical protein
MNFDQVEREIFAPIRNVKLSVAGFLFVPRDVLFDAGGDISFGYFLCLDGCGLRLCCLLRELNRLPRVLRVFTGSEERHCRR